MLAKEMAQAEGRNDGIPGDTCPNGYATQKWPVAIVDLVLLPRSLQTLQKSFFEC